MLLCVLRAVQDFSVLQDPGKGVADGRVGTEQSLGGSTLEHQQLL